MTDNGVTGGHVDALRESIDRLQVSVDDERAARVAETGTLRRKQATAARAIRRSNLAIAAAGIILVCGLLAQWGQSQSLRHEVDRREAERVAGAVVACENANVTRTRIVGYIDDRFGRLLGLFSAATASANATLEESAQRQTALGKIRADFFADPLPDEFKPRDCSPQAATTPAPLPSTTTLTTLAPGS